MADSKKPMLARYVIVGGMTPLLILSFFPIWTIWYDNPMEGVGYHRSLWFVAVEVVQSWVEQPDPAFPVTITGDARDLILGAIVCGIGVFFGVVAFALRSASSSTQS
jgi:hypothetical protein